MKNDKKMKKQFRRFWNRYGGLLLAGTILLAIFARFHREMVMKLLWAVLLVVVPVGVVCLIFCMVLFRMEERQRRQKRKWQKSVSGNRNESVQKQEQATPPQVREWYCSYAKARLTRLVSDLKKEGIRVVWIRPDGVCNVSTQNGYRRRAVLSDYPERYADVIADWIRQDRIASARREGKYLRLTFGTARRVA